MQDFVSRVMDGRLLALFDAWRAAFDPTRPIDAPLERFAAHADHLLIIDAEGSRNRYTHYGKAFAKAFGADLTGQVIDLLPTDILPADRRGILDFEYAFARRAERPLWRSHTAIFANGQIQTWQRLVLPAGGERLLVGAYEAPAPSPDPGDEERLLRLVIETAPVVLDDERRVESLALSLAAYCDTRQHAAEMEILATSDSLTGVANQRHFHHLAGLELEHARRMERSFSLMALDIDHFKRINDSWGHAAGDAALKSFVGACRLALREYDILGRCGGEEFAVALPNTGSDGARIIAERLRHQVEAISLVYGEGATIAFTVSIGVVCLPPSGKPGFADIADMMETADRALYRSKAEGRNRVTFAS
jgi:diguanylate cyclase (GGDEF)-like protein